MTTAKQITDTTIEVEIIARSLTAPRVTPADIENNIYSAFYFTAADGVRGESKMSASPVGMAKTLASAPDSDAVVAGGAFGYF